MNPIHQSIFALRRKAAKVDPLTQEFLKLKGDLKILQEFNDPMGAYARMPLGWEIK